MRRLVALLVSTGACFRAPDYDGTAFACQDDDRCPADFHCADDRCVPDAANELVRFAASTFTRGCAAGPDCAADAQPARTIELSSFRLHRREVTQGEYDACVATAICAAATAPSGSPALPVRGVPFAAAVAYCTQFLDARLPTEAEWERAARDSGGPFPWGMAAPTCELASYAGCASGPAPAHDRGAPILNLAGNVREWVADRYAADFYATSTDLDNPTGPVAGTIGSVRGGSFATAPDALRVWARDHEDRAAALDDLGFRCAADTD